MPEHDPRLYGRSFADVYDEWYSDLGDPADVVRLLSERCKPGGTVVELGAGTGRLAMPLAKAAFNVIALDASTSMLRQAPADLNVIASDMACTALRSESADAVLIAYNTFFNLADRSLQVDCLSESARVLGQDGILAIECFIGPFEKPSSEIGISTRPHHSRPDAIVAILTKHIKTDDGATHILGTHVEMLPEGTFTRPWRLAYLSPDGLDDLAASVGLRLCERFRDWAGAPFDADGNQHVSWYRRDR